MHKYCIALFVLVLPLFIHIRFAWSDNTIINLNIQLKNVAISKDMGAVSVGESAPYRMGNITLGPSKQTTNYSSDIPNKLAHEKIDKITKQTIGGRSVIVDYQLINYIFDENSRIKDCKCNSQDQEKMEKLDCSCFRLFDIVWFSQRVDYALKDNKGQWVQLVNLPSTFLFGTPPPATVVGVGDVKLDIHRTEINPKPEFNLFNLDQFYNSDDYKIALTWVPVPKIFILIPDDNLLKEKILSESKYQILGKANIGETAIKTITPPFWYPFDKYIFEFLIKTYFDARLDIKFTDIEDLDLETKDVLSKSSRRGDIQRFKVELLRKNILKKLFFPIILATIPILLLFKGDFPTWKRYLMYIPPIGGLLVSLPQPINIPKTNILSISLSLIFISLYLFIEKQHLYVLWKTIILRQLLVSCHKIKNFGKKDI